MRPVLIAFLAMVAVTAILIVTDLDHFRIPNRILYPGTAVCFVLLVAGELMDPEAREASSGPSPEPASTSACCCWSSSRRGVRASVSAT